MTQVPGMEAVVEKAAASKMVYNRHGKEQVPVLFQDVYEQVVVQEADHNALQIWRGPNQHFITNEGQV